MGVRPRLHRRRLPGGLLTDPPRREEGERGRLPQGDGRLLREPWRHDYPCDDRQGLLLSLEGLPLCLPRARPQAHPDQALYAQDKRQSRALYPDRPARMGLRSGLPHLGSPRRCVADLAAPIQLAPAAPQPKSKSARQPPRSDRGQPVEAPHATVILTSSEDAKLARGKALGADHLINYRTEPDWSRPVKAFTDGRGADLIIEIGGAGTLAQSIRAVRVGGMLAMIGVVAGAAASDIPLPLVVMRQVRMQGVTLGSRADFEAMLRACVAARLHPVLDEQRFAFEQAPALRSPGWLRASTLETSLLNSGRLLSPRVTSRKAPRAVD